MHRRLTVLLIWGGISSAVIGCGPAFAEAMTDEARRQVARLQLARSIRAFAAGTVANANCLVQTGSLSRSQADDAITMALLEMGLDPAVQRHPQVQKAAELLKPKLDAACGLHGLNDGEARRLVQDEL